MNPTVNNRVLFIIVFIVLFLLWTLGKVKKWQSKNFIVHMTINKLERLTRMTVDLCRIDSLNRIIFEPMIDESKVSIHEFVHTRARHRKGTN